MKIAEIVKAAAVLDDATVNAELINDVELALFNHDYVAAEMMSAQLLVDTTLTVEERDKAAMLYLMARQKHVFAAVADDIVSDAEQFYAI